MRIYSAKLTCDRIFELSKEKGWTDSKLASILNLTPQAISKWRRGAGSPSIEMLTMLQELFEVDINDLIGRQEVDIDFNL